jgi:hypothetical protein
MKEVIPVQHAPLGKPFELSGIDATKL